MSAEFKLSSSSKFIILTAVLASLLEIIDTSIVNVAIPTMMGNLGATLEDISWVVTGYIIANAIVLPLSAWLASQIGRRKYYTGCILLFTITSVACGLAPNLETLVFFRILQGLAGGALLPTSQALIQEQFPREKAGMASAIYGMSVMIGPTLGPTLGGYLTDHFGWRMIFNINLPLGLIAAALALVHVVNHAPDPNAPKRKIDGWGLLLLCVGVGCLQFVLERGQADGWLEDTKIVVASVIAAFCLPFFVYWELRVEQPIIQLKLFLSPVVRAGTLLMSMVGFQLYGLVFLLPVFLTRLLHFEATQIGEMFIPGALLTAFCMPMIGQLLKRFDARLLVLFGICTISSMFLLMTTFSPQTGEGDLYRALLVRGLAMGFLFVPINAVVLSQFRGMELGQVSGLLNLSRQLGGSLGIALIATLLDRNTKLNRLRLIEHLNPFELGVRWNPVQTLGALESRVQSQIFVMSYIQLMWVLVFCLLFSLIPLVWLKAPARAKVL